MGTLNPINPKPLNPKLQGLLYLQDAGDITWLCRVWRVEFRALAGGEDRALGQVPTSQPNSTRHPKQRSLESDCV